MNEICPLGKVVNGKFNKANEDDFNADFTRVHDFNNFNDKYSKIKNVNAFLNDFFCQLTRKRIKNSFSRDHIIVLAVNYVEELDIVINRMFEQLFELFGVYFPEASLKIETVEKFGKVLSNGLDRKDIAKLLGISSESMGADLDKTDLSILEKNIFMYNQLLALKDLTKDYISGLVKQLTPNLYEVATPILGAKLIATAGGLKGLAQMSSSTIQLIGAEKALFRHLKSGAKPPKHGIIIQHPLMNKVQRDNKGKVARTLAGKISIAAKTDYYSKGKENVSKLILKQLNERIRGLR